MNILLSVNNMGLGGVSTYVAHLANGLSANHRVVLFDHYPYYSDYQAVSFLYDKVILENMSRNPLKDKLLWKGSAFLKRVHGHPGFWESRKNRYLLKVLKRNKIDVIISFDKFSDLSVVNVVEDQYPVILSVHGSYDISEYTRPSPEEIIKYEKVFRTVKGIVYKADCNIKILDEYADTSQIRVVKRIFHGFTSAGPTADSLVIRSRLGISRESFVFGMIGRGVPEKGWKEALDAFIKARSHYEGLSDFVVLGESEYLLALREEYSRESSIHFTGFVQNNIDWIQMLDVGVMPSYAPTENFTFSVVEYLFCGKPAIATEHGEIPTAMDDHGEKAGILVPLLQKRPDVEALSQAMLSYLRDRNLYREHVARTSGAFSKFNSEKAVHDYEEVINKVLENTDSQ